MTPSDFQLLGIMGMLIGGVFGLVFWINTYGGGIITLGLAVVFTIFFFIGIGSFVYSLPLVEAESQKNNQIELRTESYLKQSDCKTIQQYLLDTAQNDNETTKYADKVFKIKCKGVLIT